MKPIGLILFILLLLPIYAIPWVGGLGTAVSAMEHVDAAIDDRAVDGELVDDVSLVAMATWVAEAVCYALLFAVCLIFARGARWIAGLIVFAAAFDLLPLLDFIPLIPTVMFIIAFVFMAKAQPPDPQASHA